MEQRTSDFYSWGGDEVMARVVWARAAVGDLFFTSAAGGDNEVGVQRGVGQLLLLFPRSKLNILSPLFSTV